MVTHVKIGGWLALLALPVVAGAWLMLEVPRSLAEPQTDAKKRPAGAPRPVQPSPENLLGNQPMPYLGFGAVWIGPDGLVLIETENGGGVAFFMKPAALALVEENREIGFKRPVPGQQRIYEFTADRRTDGNSCGAVYRLAGDLSLDRDEETGHLELIVQGGGDTFKAVFTFVDSQASTEQRTDDRSNSCSCNCSHPSGGSCSANKTCPDGFACNCTCSCTASRTTCRCSPCVGLIKEVVAEPVVD